MRKCFKSILFIFLSLMIYNSTQESKNPWGDYCNDHPNGSYMRKCVKVAYLDL